MDARTIIAKLRDREVPTDDEIGWFAGGLASGAVSDAQAGAFAMAVCLNGLGEAGRVALTRAMRDSGRTLSWDLPGPVSDKHSTGGIGDCVSLLLAPILAEAGVFVPMISGRGLGHTGGTLDKLEAIPGFTVDQPEDVFARIVAEVGCAIVSASGDLAPADKRLYAIRDVSGTVESIDLITASILSKKLAAGLGSLVLDVKAGSGAFMTTDADAAALAGALVETANGAGCRTGALVTDMDQPLADAIGNAVEVRAVLDALGGGDSRLVRVTVALCGAVLALAGVAADAEAGEDMARAILGDGRAAERFQRMVAAHGGPGDFLERPELPKAAILRELPSPRAGVVAAMDGHALGMTVVHMGGGRLRGGDAVDPAVGLTGLPEIGQEIDAGAPLAVIHARDGAMADRVSEEVLAAIEIGADLVAPPALVRQRIGL